MLRTELHEPHIAHIKKSPKDFNIFPLKGTFGAGHSFMTTLIVAIIMISVSMAGTAQISIPNAAFTDAQNFTTLVNTGTSSTVPAGWAFFETGVNNNAIYATGTGSSNTGDTYSFGLANDSERAFGGFQTGSLIPTIGVCYTNNTGGIITGFTVTYTGETWRVGTANRSDGLQFQYNQSTTAINGSGTWTSFPVLDYFNPGQATGSGTMQHSATVSSSISGLSIQPGATFCFRWNDFNASGADDGMAVDDYSLTALSVLTATVTPAQPTCSTPTQGSVSIDLTGNFNNNTTDLEYAIVSGSTFTGTPTFTPLSSDPLSVTSGTGTLADADGETYTVRIRLKSDNAVFIDETYSLTSPITATATETMTWTGSVSTDWANACNWSPNGVPTATNPVSIPNVANDPVIGSGIVAVAKEIILTGNGSLSVSSSGSLTVASGGNDITFEGYGNTLTNDGTINVGNGSGIGFAFRDLRYNEYGRGSIITNRGTINTNNADGGIVLSGFLTSLNVVNESAGIINGNFIITGGKEFELTNYGTINYSSGDNWAFDLSASLTVLTVKNYGTIRITSGTGIKVGEGSMVNQPCGKIIMTAGDYLDNNSSGDGTSNFGLMVLSNNLNTMVSLFVNRGVLKYGSLTGAVNNSSVIINNSLPIFTYGGTYNGTINGIFTDTDATLSAGTFTAPNTFVPSGLPAGSQTLYAKITPSGGACSYVVPFTYNNVAKKLFVKADAAGANNGASWTDALTNLQSALAIAITGDEIWVAKGTYKPTADASGNTAPTDPRTKTFVMKDGVKIYGSFAGTEANLSERTLAVMAANPAILSGDFNGDDVVSGSGSTLSITGNAENSIHVIDNNYTSGNPLTATAVLDGFVITGGNADATAGGGMSNSHASPSLSNIIFIGNNAFGGGGMHNFNSNPVLKSITFSNNKANSGGGMNNSSSNPSLTNVSFSGNNATTQGGGMSNGYFGPSLSNVSFFNNNATNDGGAIFNALGASPNISNSVFWGNTKNGNANAIGADIFNGSGTTTVKNTLLQSPNTTSNYPGGKFIFPDASNIFAQNPLFVNATDPDGADNIFRTADDGLMLSVCSPAINAGNNADIPSGITTDIVGNPRTFNTTVDMGAYELQANPATRPTLTVGTIPAICTGATSFTIPYTATTGTPTTYSISGTGITTVTDGTLPSGSITVSLSAAASGSSIPFTLTVKNASGCTSAEITGSVTVNATTLYVDASNTSGTQNGTSWATAYTKLQDAIDAATTFGCGVEIRVAAGTYLPTKDMTGNASPSDNRTKTFYIKKDGIKIYGGYPAGGGTRNVATNLTILSGDFNANDMVSGSGSTLSFSNNTENAYHVVHIDGTTSNGNITAATLLDGFRISGGNADAIVLPNYLGGGVFNDGEGSGNVCSPTFVNCTLSGNSARTFGGGMYNRGYGDGTSSPSLTNCTLNGNKAGDGGGIYNSGNDGGISRPILTNCTLSGNSASNGGGMYNGGRIRGISSPILTNCTLSGNSASQGGGMYNSALNLGTSSPTLSNCIFWSNGSNQIVNSNATGTTISYSIYDDGTPNGTLTLPTGVTNGGNNLDSNPLFTDAANGNYTLTSCSPAINAGNNAAIPSGITTDLAGNPRIFNTTVDMGAYELQANPATRPTLTVGTIPAICTGATSFKIPYSATTGTPNTYSISGTGITTVTNRTLPSGSITVSLSAAASGTSIPFTLTVKNASGCTSAEIMGSVRVNPTTTPSVSINPMTVCAGTSTTLTATATNGGSSPQFIWTKNNSPQGSSDFINKTTADGLGSNGVLDVYVDNTGKIYAATFGGLSISTNGGTSFSNRTTASGLGNNIVFGVYVDNAGTIYAATAGGLSILTNGGTSFSNKTTANGLGVNRVERVYVDNAGTIYAATAGGLSISTDGGTSFINKTTANGLGNNRVDNVYVDNAGTIYAATAGGLSISTNGGTSFINKTTADGLGSNFVEDIYVGNDGTIYAATYAGGVSISTDGGMRFTNINKGLVDNRVNAVHVGTDGTIYAAVFVSFENGSLGIARYTLPVSNAVAGDVYKVTLVPSADVCSSPAMAMASVTVGICQRVIYVNAANTNPTQNGQSWNTAFANLKVALDTAAVSSVTPVEVWVANGTYKPGPNRTDYFNIPSGVKVYGGFTGTESQLTQRVIAPPLGAGGLGCFLSGEIGSAAANDNNRHVVVFQNTNLDTRLDGFTITRGYAEFVPSVANTNTPDLNASGGGVLAINKAKGTIANCTITDNKAIFGGGIFQQDSSTVNVSQSVIWGNEATFGGAAYHQTKSTPTYTNCLLVQNKGLGGAMYNNDSNPTLMNCTIASNDGNNVIGGIYNTKSTPTLTNSILWGNSHQQTDMGTVISYSVVQGGASGMGNLSNDPKLANPVPFNLALASPLGDYRLLNCSPAINAGTATGAPATDIAGNARPMGAGIDMGVYEGPGLVAPPTQTVTGNITTGTVLITAGTITATNQVSNATVEYRAASSVTLLPGFQATGNTFQATIGAAGCN